MISKTYTNYVRLGGIIHDVHYLINLTRIYDHIIVGGKRATITVVV